MQPGANVWCRACTVACAAAWVRAPGTLWVMQDWDDFGERVNGQPQPEGVCTAPQPRANLVQLHVRQLEIPEDALVEGCAMLSCPREPGGDRGGAMAEHPYRRRDIKPFRKRSEHFRNPMGCRFEAIERRHPEGRRGGR